MGKKEDMGYKELQISNVNWCTQFFLVNPGKKLPEDYRKLDKYPELDFGKCYDIKTLDGQVFEGSRVYCRTHRHQGSGGMSEDSSSSIGFFQAGGLEAVLDSGFLMRVNEGVTKQMQTKKKEGERKEKLERLYEERKILDNQIKELESK